MQRQSDFGLHVSQLLLYQLSLRQRTTKLQTIQSVLTSGVPAELGRTQRAPGDTVTGRVQTGERTFQTGHVRQHVFFRNEHIVHHDFTGDGGTQANLALDRRRAQTFPAFLQNEATDDVVVGFCPDHKHVSNGAVGDPHLGALEQVATFGATRAGNHGARVGAVVRLGQTEAADKLAAGQLRQIFLLLLFTAKFVDRHHHQRGLHTHHRAVAGVNALNFTRDQAVADIVQPASAVLGRNGCTQQAQLAHFTEDFHVGLLVAERVQHPRHKLVLAVLACTVTHHALFFSQLLIQQQRIFPVETCLGCGHELSDIRFIGGRVPRGNRKMSATLRTENTTNKRLLCRHLC